MEEKERQIEALRWRQPKRSILPALASNMADCERRVAQEVSPAVQHACIASLL
jgi:hypothetical protein